MKLRSTGGSKCGSHPGSADCTAICAAAGLQTNWAQAIDRTTVPSTRSAAPVAADACALHAYLTMAATWSGGAKRWSTDNDRAVAKKTAPLGVPALEGSCALGRSDDGCHPRIPIPHSARMLWHPNGRGYGGSPHRHCGPRTDRPVGVGAGSPVNLS